MPRGQARKDPFHVNRDDVKDNLTVTRKLRLPTGSQIRARTMFATATLTGLSTISVPMPYAGNLNLTVAGATNGDTVIIENPFLGTAAVPLVLNSAPAGAVAAIAFNSAGQATLTLTTAVNGLYVISVGARNDSRNNNYSQ